MGITITQTAGTVIPTGEYPAKIVSIEETTGQFGPQLKVKFMLSGAPDIDGTTTSAWYGQTFSPKSKLFALAVAAFGGRAIPATYNFNSDDLLNRSVRVVVVEKQKPDGSTFSKVDSVKPAKSANGTPAQAAQAAPSPVPLPPPEPPAEQIPF